MADKCVFTVATGSKYLTFAFTLARSYRYHNDIMIPFFIISDKDFKLPADLNWVKKKIVSDKVIGKGIEYKFRFYEFLPAYKSLFIDADSIIYKNISSLFDIPNLSIMVIGKKIKGSLWGNEPLWGHDPVATLEKFDIPYMIHFSGALYYIIKSEETKNIYETADYLIKTGFPFERHRYSFNDEPILSISLSKHQVSPIENTGNIWGQLTQLETYKNLNVLKGLTRFRNVGETHLMDYMPEGDYSPMIIHTGSSLYKQPWLFDAARLKLFYGLKLNPKIADTLTDLFVTKPYFGLRRLFYLFR